MRIFFYVIILGALVSCSTKKHSVVIYSQLHHPHCGGAAPTEETIKGYDTPNNMDIIIAGQKDSTKWEINGSRNIKLKAGQYSWYQGKKATPTNELLTSLENDLNSNYVIKGADCIDEWKKQKDGVFQIDKYSDTVYLTLQYKCYTGVLPCVNYIGPSYP